MAKIKYYPGGRIGDDTTFLNDTFLDFLKKKYGKNYSSTTYPNIVNKRLPLMIAVRLAGTINNILKRKFSLH